MSRPRFCIDCMEDFRYDDCGGYNPPCECGQHCRSCHEAELREIDAWGDDDDDGYRDLSEYSDYKPETPTPAEAPLAHSHVGSLSETGEKT